MTRYWRVIVAVLVVTLVAFGVGGAFASSDAGRVHCTVPLLRVVNRPELEWGGRYERWGHDRPVIVLNVAPGHNAHGLAWTLRHELGHAQADRLGMAPSEKYADDVADGLVPLTCPTRVAAR